jgi:hypothetical protein
MLSANNSGWWQPPRETLDAIAAVLMAHWRTASTYPQSLFWPHPTEWLPTCEPHHLTSGGKLIR